MSYELSYKLSYKLLSYKLQIKSLMEFIKFKIIHILPSNGQRVVHNAHAHIFGYTFFGHHSEIFGQFWAAIFHGSSGDYQITLVVK